MNLCAVGAQKDNRPADQHLQFGHGVDAVGGGEDLAAGFQDSFYFRQAVVYVLQVVQDMVGHHHIKAGFGVGQAHAIANSQSFATGRVVKQHERRKIQREIAEVGFSLKQLRIMIAAPATEIEHDFVPLPCKGIEGPTHKIEFGNGEFGVGFVFDPQVLCPLRNSDGMPSACTDSGISDPYQ